MNVLLFLLTNNQSDTRFQDFPGTVVTIAGVRSASDRPPGDQSKVQCCAGLLAACLRFVDTHAAEILGGRRQYIIMSSVCSNALLFIVAADKRAMSHSHIIILI